MLEFNYAIVFPNGKYYTGRTGQCEQGEKSEAFTYTEKGAYAKIDRLGKSSEFWKKAIVKRVF